jgi:hypothetical protein
MEELDTDEQKLLKGYEIHGAHWSGDHLKHHTEGTEIPLT